MQICTQIFISSWRKNHGCQFMLKLFDCASNFEDRTIILGPRCYTNPRPWLLVSGDITRTKLTAKFYRLWKELFDDRIRQYESKTRAVQLVWKRMLLEAKHEKQRSFDIWRTEFSRFKLIKFKVKKIVAHKIYKSQAIALSAWKNNDSYFDTQIRLGLLAQNFTHKQYLQTLFHKFHSSSQSLKRQRQSTLAHTLKAWKDFLANQKYLMGQNLLSSHFHTESFTSLIKACFDGWKHYKQSQLFKKTHLTLHGDELKRIEQLTEGNRHMMRERRLLEVARGCDTVKVKLQKRVWSYINHWRMVNVDYHEKVNTALKEKVIRLCWSSERVAFYRWKWMHANNIKIERLGINRDKRETIGTERNSIYYRLWFDTVRCL